MFLKGRQNDHQAATPSETPLHGLSRPSARLSIQKAVVVAYWEKQAGQYPTRIDFNIFNTTVIHLFALSSIFAHLVVIYGAFCPQCVAILILLEIMLLVDFEVNYPEGC